MTLLEKFKIKIGMKKDDISKDDELNLHLESAENDILDYCNRKALLTRMEGLKLELAVINYNRQGSEGEASRSEGGISITYEIPPNVQSKLKAYRKLKAVGIANEN
ncbi:MAG: phage head-tail connector protein [Clostridium sp.]